MFICPVTMVVEKHDRMAEKISNENHVSDINHAIQYTRWFLTLLGIWPHVISNPSRIERYVSRLTLPFCSIIMAMILIPTLSYITLRHPDRLEVLVLIGPIGFHVSNIFKLFVLVIRTSTVKLCVSHIESDWRRIDNQTDRKIMMKNLRLGRGLTTVCVVCMYSSCVFYNAIMPFWTGSIINELNETVRPHAFPGTDIFIDSQASVTYEIVFCGVFISGFFHFTVMSSVFNLAAAMVTHACGQIQIVMSRLTGLVDSVENESNLLTVWNRIALIIQMHVRVLRFSSRIDEVLREISFIEVLSSTMIICLLEYYCLTEWNNGNSVAVMTYLCSLIALCFNLFIYCHIGELLKEQCSRVGKAAYMMDWYKLPGKTGLALVMVITMAKYPRKLTAGRMVELSINTFGNIMRTTLAYLNMLRAVAE